MAADNFGPDFCTDALYSRYNFDRHPRRKRVVDPNACCTLRNQLRTKLCSPDALPKLSRAQRPCFVGNCGLANKGSEGCVAVDDVGAHLRFASYRQAMQDAAVLRFSQGLKYRATLLVEASSPREVMDGVVSRQVDLVEAFDSETVALAKLSNISIYWAMTEPSEDQWKMQAAGNDQVSGHQPDRPTGG
ncbi:hypothetical protein CDD80_2233 [Ophiocordyceps camponoti-rufipedis]|uniref:Uncharacterized protein n=1 Tax=Ophiocordyceps camponoti-rufipedis TaxID=2004952 RepID=A0A2C5XSW5_9HYPO|nr:hypothetical protein CDD80_2233 [Ophiocordyceps camponoti-rufipedis]